MKLPRCAKPGGIMGAEAQAALSQVEFIGVSALK